MTYNKVVIFCRFTFHSASPPCDPLKATWYHRLCWHGTPIGVAPVQQGLEHTGLIKAGVARRAGYCPWLAAALRVKTFLTEETATLWISRFFLLLPSFFSGVYKAKPKETTQITDPQLSTISSLQNLHPRKQNIHSSSLMLAALLLLPPPSYKMGGKGGEKRTKII